MLRDLEKVAMAMRFGIIQGPKHRVIDDASCCGVNSTISLKEPFQLHPVVLLAAALTRASPLCQGRAYDLKSAYKQFGSRKSDRELLRLPVKWPGYECPCFLGLKPWGQISEF